MTPRETKSLFDLAVSMAEDTSQRELFEDYVKITDIDVAHIRKL